MRGVFDHLHSDVDKVATFRGTETMAGMFLPEFELYLMLAVARLGEGAYGAAMRREIEDCTGRPVSIGALYATLGRLEEKGLVSVHPSDPEPGQRGRPRKYCRLTAEGEAAVRHSTEMLTRMMRGAPWLTPAAGERP